MADRGQLCAVRAEQRVLVALGSIGRVRRQTRHDPLADRTPAGTTTNPGDITMQSTRITDGHAQPHDDRSAPPTSADPELAALAAAVIASADPDLIDDDDDRSTQWYVDLDHAPEHDLTVDDYVAPDVPTPPSAHALGVEEPTIAPALGVEEPTIAPTTPPSPGSDHARPALDSSGQHRCPPSNSRLYIRELLAAQVAYALRGWATIELRPPLSANFPASEDERRNRARPLLRHWPDHAIDPTISIDARLRAIKERRDVYPRLGIGLVMGPQLDHTRYHVAVDEDVPDALATLAAQHAAEVTPTWRQTARRGVHHVYLLTPEQQSAVPRLHGRGGALHVRLPGIDVLGARRYIVGAPSTHRDGATRYTVIDDGDPAELPDWLWRVIVAAATPVGVRAATPEPAVRDDPDLSDDEIDQRVSYETRRFRAECMAAAHRPAIQGEHGWATTMRLVGAIVTGLAIRREDALDIVLRVYSPRCQPPWSEGEIEYMVDRAIAQPYRPRGWLVPPSIPRTRGGESGGGAAPARATLARAEIVGVDETRGAVWYRFLDGPHAGQQRRRPMDWPPTPRSRALWDALARAVGVGAITQPHAQLWRRTVLVEIVDDPTGEYAWRLGRVYPLAAAPTP